MFRNLLKPDSGLMITMTQISDVIFLSLFWILGCIPVVTVGTACAALYDSVYRAFRCDEKHSWQRFLNVFKENWKKGLLPTLIFLLFIFIIVRVVINIWNGAAYGQVSMLMFAGVAFIAVVLIGILSLMFPMFSRFDNSTGVLIKNTFVLGFANLPRTIILGLLNTLTAFLCMRFVFPMFFLPALSSLISTLLIEPVFKPFMPEEKD
ncbi:MAG: DUF624 domain-containing protein [Eubacteriales bacterium]|nr:DUF624 domain-containing protein [Eubacteriales bacterium]